MEISKSELTILNNTDFLLAKAKVLEKVNHLLENTRTDLFQNQILIFLKNLN